MEIFLALMENYDKALYLEEAALNADGAAMERYGIYQESITAKQNELKAAFEEFAYSGSVVDLVKSFYELGEAAISVLNAFKPLIELFAQTLTILSKLTGGVFDFVSALLTLDVDYFKEIFGKDTQAEIENTEDKISSIEKKIKDLENSDIDIDVKQEELDTLIEALKEANDELEQLRREQRNNGYERKVKFDYYNTATDNNFQREENVNLSNAITLYQELGNQISNVTAKQNSYGKSYKDLSKEQQLQYKQNEKTLESLRNNKKAVEDAIVAIYDEIVATQEVYDANGLLSDSLTETEKAIITLVEMTPQLSNAYHDLYDATEEASTGLDDVEDSANNAADSTNKVINVINELNITVDELDKQMSAVNAALEQYQNEGRISAKVAQDLINANSKFADTLVISANGITLNTERLKELAQQSIHTAKASVASASAAARAWNSAQASIAKGGAASGEGTSKWMEQYVDTNWTSTSTYDSSEFDYLLKLLDSYSYGTGVSNYRPTTSGSSSSSSGSNRDTSDRDAERELKEQQRAYLDSLKERQNAFKAYLDAILKVFEKEKDALEKQKDEWEDYYDAKIDAIKEQEELEDQELERQEKLLEIERLKSDLAKANQQVVRVYLRNQGFVFRQDTEAIAAAQEKLSAALKEYSEWQKKLDRDNEIKELEDAKDKVLKDLDEQIDKLDELADAWKESLDITEDVTTYKDLLGDMAKFEKANLDERLKYLDDFTNAYIGLINIINEANKIYNSGVGALTSGGSGSGSGSNGGYITSIGSGGSSGGSSGEIWYNSMGSPVKSTGGSSDRFIFDGEIGLIYHADGKGGGTDHTIWEDLGIKEPPYGYDLGGGIQSWFLDNWGKITPFVAKAA